MQNEIETATQSSPEMARLRRLLQAYLDRHGLSQRELSTRIGPNAGLVKDLMTVKPDGSPRVLRPRRDTLVEIGRVMGLSVDEVWSADAPIPDFYARPPLPQERSRDAHHRLVRVAPVDGAGGAGRSDLIDLVRVEPAKVEDGWLLAPTPDARSPLSLPSSYVEERLGVLAVHARHWRISATPKSGLLRRGDDAIIDASVHVARDAGLYAVAGEDGVDVVRLPDEDGREVLGRVAWFARPNPV